MVLQICVLMVNASGVLFCVSFLHAPAIEAVSGFFGTAERLDQAVYHDINMPDMYSPCGSE